MLNFNKERFSGLSLFESLTFRYFENFFEILRYWIYNDEECQYQMDSHENFCKVRQHRRGQRVDDIWR